MSERIGPWIQTFSGVKFYPFDPRPEEVRIADIAHALAHECRFAGHTIRFYSVAQHSLEVSYLVPEHLALWGLLHDASEAYLRDIPRGIKHCPELRAYKEIDSHLQTFIFETFGLRGPMPPEVKRADNDALCHEVRFYMARGPLRERYIGPLKEAHYSYPLNDPAGHFLDRFDYLTRKVAA